ncbi:hypothetical protein MBLNU13_g03390t1 [Cladosporium sp. NU13]
MSSTNNSRSSPSAVNGSNTDRPRLTDAEKKQNHILSEQKRRQAIRMGFDRLAAMTPGMNGLGRSEANVLDAAVDEIKKQTLIKERIKRKLLKEHPEVTEEWFENFYKDGLAETIATSGFPHTPVPTVPASVAPASAAPAPAAPAPANTVSSPTNSNTGSTGSSSSRGKKRVKKEN